MRDPRLAGHTIRIATEADVQAVKAIADREKRSLGFVHRGSLVRALHRGELLVADSNGDVIGFCHLYRRRDGVVTIYHIAVAPAHRRQGIGVQLVGFVAADACARGAERLRLKCPADLDANRFYAQLGFERLNVIDAATRPLNVWERELTTADSLQV